MSAVLKVVLVENILSWMEPIAIFAGMLESAGFHT